MGPPMKSGKSKKNSTVPSSADKQETLRPKTKSADKKVLAGKSSSNAMPIRAERTVKKRSEEPKSSVKAAAIGKKAEAPSTELNKRASAPPMPAAIVKSAMKGASATPGISPTLVPTEPAASSKRTQKAVQLTSAKSAQKGMPAAIIKLAVTKGTSTPGISATAIPPERKETIVRDGGESKSGIKRPPCKIGRRDSERRKESTL